MLHCCFVGAVRDSLLVHALADILCQAADSSVVVCDITNETASSSLPDGAENVLSTSSAVSDEPTMNAQSGTSLQDELSSSSRSDVCSSETAVKRRRLGHEQFHNSLRWVLLHVFKCY